MRTMIENNKPKNATEDKIFNFYIAEKDSSFASQLKDVVRDCEILFSGLDFKTTVVNDPTHFKIDNLKGMDLVFIEDAYLLELPKPASAKPKIPQDVILLLDGHFVGEEAYKIKHLINENSLNLTGHISLTNYPFNLVKLLVIDFIKTKIR